MYRPHITHKYFTTVLTVMAAFCFSSIASAGTAPVTPRSMKFEIRKGPAVVGHARIDFNRPRRKKKKIHQKVVIKATVNPLNNAALRIDVNSHSWINTDLFPVRANWDWTSLGKERTVRAKYGQKSIDGLYKSSTKTYRMKERRKDSIGDVVSFAAWLAGQDLKPGQHLKTTTYTGLKLYDVSLKVEEPVQLELNSGLRRVLPVQAVAVRPGKTRTFRLWVDADTGSLTKLSFSADYIGQLDLLLVRERR